MSNWRANRSSLSSDTVRMGLRGSASRRALIVGAWLLLWASAGTVESIAAEPGITRIAKAAPDEFFTGIGKGYFPLGQQPPGVDGQPKVNQAWVWGMTKAGDSIWFGTIANGFSLAGTGIFGVKNPRQNEYNVNEYQRSAYPGISPLLKGSLGDWRPSHIYRYQPGVGLQDKTPNDPLLLQTVGIRSAGASDEIVLMAGPSLVVFGINVFAFDAQSGDYLGSKTILEFSDIRRWVQINGALYTGTLDTWAKNGGGKIVRWKGTVTNPFEYEVVGRVDNEVGTLVAHEGRLFALTWPVVSPVTASLIGAKPTNLSGIWVSPPVPAEGFTAADQLRWRKVWSIDRYDPDALVARSIWLGGGASFDGHLVWGTIQVPGSGSEEIFKEIGDPASIKIATEAFIKAQRSVPLFRGKLNDNGTFTVDLLYGDLALPVFTPTGKGKGVWSIAATRAGPALLGPAGFGDPSNLYIWSMNIHENKLYMGTFDWSFLLFGNAYVKGQTVPADMGADLIQMTSTSTPAMAVSQTGLGSPLNLGIRNMASHTTGLYCGTATAANLLTDTGDNLPEGGWEFLKIDPNSISLTPLRTKTARTAPSADQIQDLLQSVGGMAR